MSVSIRAGFEKIPSYRAGKPAQVGPDGLSAKLSSNENPYEPLPSVLQALAAALPTSVHRYPNIAAPELTAALAARLDVAPEQLAFGAGSVEVAAQLIHALAGAGDEVMYAWRSFEAYPILVQLAGATPVQVPLDAAGGHDLDAMADAITERTKLIFVCNPNNPTGTTVSHAAVAAFLERVPANVLVVIDEAYVHFNVEGDTARGMDLFRAHENVAVLHTFSKAYGLAGLRIGYAVAPAGIAEALRKAAVPFAVSALAQAGAVASLAAEPELQERIDVLVAERGRMVDELRAAGLPVTETQANFLWIPAGKASDAVAGVFAERGVSVRCFSDDGIRISVGAHHENDAVIEVSAAAAALL